MGTRLLAAGIGLVILSACEDADCSAGVKAYKYTVFPDEVACSSIVRNCNYR